MDSFKEVFSGKQKSVKERLSRQQQETADHNREVLYRLIEIMRANISKVSALRGQRDDGMPSIGEDDYVNMGNFKTDVVSRSKFDPVLQQHMKKCSKSIYATYTSKYAQADFTTVFLSDLQHAIIEEVRNQHGKIYLCCLC